MNAVRLRSFGLGRHRDILTVPLLDDAINLLPYRRMRAAQRRRTHGMQFLLAGCLGLVGALTSGYWQQTHAARDDERRVRLEQRLHELEPVLAETGRLEHAIAAYARRAALIAGLAVSRDDLFYLLQALGRNQVEGLALDEVRFVAGRATVTGVAPDQRVLTAWTRQLERALGIEAVEIKDIQALRPSNSAQRHGLPGWPPPPVTFTVHLAVGDSAALGVADGVSRRVNSPTLPTRRHLIASGAATAMYPARQLNTASPVEASAIARGAEP